MNKAATGTVATPKTKAMPPTDSNKPAIIPQSEPGRNPMPEKFKPVSFKCFSFGKPCTIMITPNTIRKKSNPQPLDNKRIGYIVLVNEKPRGEVQL